MKNAAKYVATVALALAACGTNPVAESYRSITATRTLCAQYLARARISVSQAETCLVGTNNARAITDKAADAQAAGKPVGPELAASVDAILGAIEKQLTEQAKTEQVK